MVLLYAPTADDMICYTAQKNTESKLSHKIHGLVELLALGYTTDHQLA